eukprot:755163-Hanusia_phi.AAC.1
MISTANLRLFLLLSLLPLLLSLLLLLSSDTPPPSCFACPHLKEHVEIHECVRSDVNFDGKRPEEFVPDATQTR